MAASSVKSEIKPYIFSLFILYLHSYFIVVHGSIAGISRKPVLDCTLNIKILRNGETQFSFKVNVKEDAIWLPRLGYEFQLLDAVKEFKYFGKGPLENYCDMCHHALVGMYQSNTVKEYKAKAGHFYST